MSGTRGALELRGVSKRFGATDVIRNVDLDIAPGEFMVFVGPSGCGKSTLLRMIAGLEPISDGTLNIDGRLANELEPRDRGIAMVFQSYALYPHLTVFDNLAFGLILARTPKAEINRRVTEAARVLQIDPLLDRRPAQLSGGQRQRVAIGRAIVRDPAVFLFDEPLSNLDAALRMDMRMEIARLHRTLGATMIYVTHDQVEAMTLADRIVVLDAGRIRQVGPPMEVWRHPANRFVAGFIGSPRMNFLPVRIEAMNGGTARVRNAGLLAIEVPAPLLAAAQSAVGAEAVLGIRPQHLHLAATGNGGAKGRLVGQVVLVERLGAETVISMQSGDGRPVLAVIPQDADFAPGDSVALEFDPSSAHLFPADDPAAHSTAEARP